MGLKGLAGGAKRCFVISPGTNSTHGCLPASPYEGLSHRPSLQQERCRATVLCLSHPYLFTPLNIPRCPGQGGLGIQQHPLLRADMSTLTQNKLLR